MVKINRLFTNEEINYAVEQCADVARFGPGGYAQLTSARAIVRRRISEITMERREKANEFENWAKRTFQVP